MKRPGFVLLAFCALVWICPLLSAADEKSQAEPTLHQKIYYFEHSLLPKWTHNSSGHFFADLSHGALDKLVQAAGQIVGPEYAQQLTVRTLPGNTQVLITFAPPDDIPLCYFVLIEKQGDTYRYLTLEKTEDFMNDGTKTVVGEWDPQGAHRNMGMRKYVDADHFIAEVTGQAKAQG